MKKKSLSRRSPPGRSGTPATVAEYLVAVPEPARSTLKQMRAAIQSSLPPGATETISYRIPTFRLERMLVSYTAFTRHTSLFPSAAVIEAFKDDLAGFVTSKGTVQFPLDRPLPIALIKKLVKARVAQSRLKKPRQRT